MTDKLIIVFFGYCAGMAIGIWATTNRVSTECDSQMYTELSRHEYVCMKVPANGMPKSYVELKEAYKL